MKLLLDQNISYRLVKRIQITYPGSQQIGSLGLSNLSDRAIWEYAKKEGYTIVTFDSDFYDISITRGHPPKLIWIRAEDQTRSNIERLLLEKEQQIVFFSDDPESGCLEIN